VLSLLCCPIAQNGHLGDLGDSLIAGAVSPKRSLWSRGLTSTGSPEFVDTLLSLSLSFVRYLCFAARQPRTATWWSSLTARQPPPAAENGHFGVPQLAEFKAVGPNFQLASATNFDLGFLLRRPLSTAKLQVTVAFQRFPSKFTLSLSPPIWC